VTKLPRVLLLGLPIAWVLLFVIGPIIIAFVVSFWELTVFRLTPAFSFAAYEEFFGGVRIGVLYRTLLVAGSATFLGVLIAYPVAYFLAFRGSPLVTRLTLLLITVPFLVNYIIRNFSLAFLLGRGGPVNQALMYLGIVDQPVDGLLFSNFSVYVGLIAAYMPFMVFPLWLSLSGINKRHVEASWMLGATPVQTFFRVTLPLSLPGLSAAAIFGFVGVSGDGAVPLILGGAGYVLMGNTIESTMSALNYPLAAAMSSVTVAAMLALLITWYTMFDIRAFLGAILKRKG
jgi:ABC-type spermidine/putrescine transport system permease subunit I